MKDAISKYLKQQASTESFVPPQRTKKPAVEELVVVEDTRPDEWAVLPETSLDDCHETAAVADELDVLAQNTEQAPAAAVEAYHVAFRAFTRGELAPSRMISVEDFQGRAKSGAILAKAIREHSGNLKMAVRLSLEEFSADASNRFQQMVKVYRSARQALDQVEDSVGVSDKQVKIDHKSIWKLFNKDNKFVNPDEINNEISDIDSLVRIATQGLSTGTMSDTQVELMNNTFITVRGGQVSVKSPNPPAPKKEYSGTDYAWIAFWGLFFSWLGLIGALIWKKKTGSEAERKRSTAQMHHFIDEIKRLDKSVDTLEAAVADAAKKARTVTEKEGAEAGTDAKVDNAEALSLALETMKHITELTYGASQLFTKIAKAN